MEFSFYNPYAEIKKSHNRLPHRQQNSTAYFVTFRLADSLPQHLLLPWETQRDAWLVQHPKPWTPETEAEYHKRFSAAIDQWLDQAHGECLLRDSAVAQLVGETLAYFEGERLHQISWVIMPNHVHALFVPIAPHTLETILHSWKSFTSHEVNKRLGRQGVLWQKDYFDRIVRDEKHLHRIVRYIRNNPLKANLLRGEYLLFESAQAKAIV